MRGIVVGLALALAMIATPAHAGGARPATWNEPSAKCATGWEQNQLDVGLTREYVEQLLDGPGRLDKGQHVYRPCNLRWQHGQYVVIYRHGVVWNSFKLVLRNGAMEVPAA